MSKVGRWLHGSMDREAKAKARGTKPRKATRKTSGLPKLGPNGTQRIEDCDPKLCEKVCCLSSKRGCFYANYYQHTYCRITEKRKQEILVEKQRR